jgi:putative salt-induced outer membrane protein YdiY
MYGAAFEHGFRAGSGDMMSFLIAGAVADEIEVKDSQDEYAILKNVKAVGILGRRYYKDSLDGLYGQAGASYLTGEAERVVDEVRNEYDVQGGEFQAGVGLQFIMAERFVVDFNITYRMPLASLKPKVQSGDAEDVMVVGFGYGIAGGIGVAF